MKAHVPRLANETPNLVGVGSIPTAFAIIRKRLSIWSFRFLIKSNDQAELMTDRKIDFVIEKAGSAWSHNKVPEKYRQNFLLTLKSYLTKGGLMEDVCPECLGNGRNEKDG